MKANCDTIQLLRQLGLRHSKDRHAIINCFTNPRAWTLEQLAGELTATHFSTVFRNIQTLLDAGVIRALHEHDGKTYYEWADQKHHDHKACKNCDVLECIPCPIPKQKTHFLELIDICTSCK